MSADSWIAGNASLEAATHKYGADFEVAYRAFKNHSDATDADLADRYALWSDHDNRGENVMRWYRERQC